MIDPSQIKMCGPSITQHEKNMVSKMMEDGWDGYQYVEQFETCLVSRDSYRDAT